MTFSSLPMLNLSTSRLLLFLLFLLLMSECHAQITPQRVTVSTPLGVVMGRVSLALDQRVLQFLGVPYAQPPLAQLRFRKPVSVRPWSGLLDASDFGPSCPQSGLGFMSEDCLNLNIYVRGNDSFAGSSAAGLRPVMLWIHGGGFEVGAGRFVDGSVLAVRGQVVVVTINYRLGMLGWLSTLDAASPGNYGLWDQRMAMEWVRDNIAAFGGDPNQVTIFGESGGGYSVGLHSLSPLNSGLFQRAVMQSGTALNRRTIALDPVGFARRFGQSLRCLRSTTSPGIAGSSSSSSSSSSSGGFDTQYLVDCARRRSVNEILRATEAAAAGLGSSTLAWILHTAPVVDGELIPEDVDTLLGGSYFTRVPFWNLDVMVGTTSAEGSLVLSPLWPFQNALRFSLEEGIPARVLRDNITTALARDYLAHGGSTGNAAAEAMYREYRSDLGDAEQGRQVVNLYGDMMFDSAAVETLQRHANWTRGRGHTRYQYLFSYTGDAGPRAAVYPGWFRGAGHGAEVPFVFGMSAADPGQAGLSLAMVDSWSNFAKFGTPNNPQQPGSFKWPAYDLTNKGYTNLDLVLTSERDLYSSRMRFWLQTIPGLRNDVTPLTSGNELARNASEASETLGVQPQSLPIQSTTPGSETTAYSLIPETAGSTRGPESTGSTTNGLETASATNGSETTVPESGGSAGYAISEAAFLEVVAARSVWVSFFVGLLLI